MQREGGREGGREGMQNPVITVICTEVKGKRRRINANLEKATKSHHLFVFLVLGCLFSPLGGPRAEGCVPREFSLCET